MMVRGGGGTTTNHLDSMLAAAKTTTTMWFIEDGETTLVHSCSGGMIHVGSILLHSLAAAAAAHMPPLAKDDDKGVGGTTTVALAIGILLLIAAIARRHLHRSQCHCLPPSLLVDCCLTTADTVVCCLLPPCRWRQLFCHCHGPRSAGMPHSLLVQPLPSQLYPRLPLTLPSIFDCQSVVVCCPSSTQLPFALSRCPPPAPSSSVIAPLPSMVGCSFLLVLPHPLCCPLPMSLSAASSLTTCQQSPGCLVQFSCWMALSGTTGNRMRACWQRHH